MLFYRNSMSFAFYLSRESFYFRFNRHGTIYDVIRLFDRIRLFEYYAISIRIMQSSLKLLNM